MRKFGDKHFMVDKDLLDRICGYANITRDDVVLEVGAGTGNLTRELAERAGKVISIEKSGNLFEELESRLKDYDNIELIRGDATKIDFPEFNKIVSNLPYSISKKITKKFLLHGFATAVLVYQKEFAEKLLAKPGHPNYRTISVFTQSTCNIELVEEVSPEAFSPQPDICSSVVKLNMDWKPTCEYYDFLNNLFNHKNKNIRNILKDAPDNMAVKKPVDIPPQELKAFFLEFIR